MQKGTDIAKFCTFLDLYSFDLEHSLSLTLQIYLQLSDSHASSSHITVMVNYLQIVYWTRLL